MGSLFEIAKSGIQAYRQALSVTGQNIANVNTEGYSKRDVALEEIGGIQGGVTDVSDQSGLGVRVDEIRRSFNAYINERLWIGHFDITSKNGIPAFRHTVLQPPENDMLYSHLENLMDISICECEKYYPAFQLVLFDDTRPKEAIEISAVEVLGRA